MSGLKGEAVNPRTSDGESPPAVIPAGLSAVIDAVEAAADRRGLTQSPAWQALQPELTALRDAGDGTGDTAGTDDDPVERLASVFRLDAVSTDLLVAAAAPDLDPNLATAYGILLGAPGPRPATVALALELAGVSTLSGRGRAALAETASLRRWELVDLGQGPWSLGRAVTAFEDVIAAILGYPVAGTIAGAMTADVGITGDLDGADGVAPLTAALAAGAPLCWVEDPPGAAGVAVARTAFARADIRCVVMDLALRPAGVALTDAARAAVRWAALRSSGLLLSSGQELVGTQEAAGVARLLADAPVPVVLVGSSRWNPGWHGVLPVVVRASPLSPAQRIALWRKTIDGSQIPDRALASYRLTPDQIIAAGRHVAAQSAVFDRPPDPLLLAESVRMLGGSGRLRTGSAAAPTSFDDLELPAEPTAALHRLANWVRLRDTVLSRGAVHGMGGKGSGIAALFTGSPGTGKTLAAHVIADAVGLELMQVDLSGVIDKYIGETEKNLERIFADAENLNVVLFFDEADALFGKRSEVRDAHDRFANQEVSYLLQRMEQFDGITVLATNLKGNLDVAFARRLHFIIHFPDPDQTTRRRLWQQLLQRAGDEDAADPIDRDRLAATVELAGGDLRNIVLAATYDAAIAGTGLGMRHVLAATVREYTKLGRRVPAGLQ